MGDEDFKILCEEIADFCNGLEAQAVKLKSQIEKLLGSEAKQRAIISEETFTVLRWQLEEGVKLGKFEVAYKNQNIVDKWQHCWNILRKNNAVIANPFHEDGYFCAYWIFPERHSDRIYRRLRSLLQK